jgi:hypothetical protein
LAPGNRVGETAVPGWRPDAQGNLKKLRFPPRNRLPGTQLRQENYASLDGNHPRSVKWNQPCEDRGKTDERNWLEKAVVRQGPTSIYYIYILYPGMNPDEGPWKVEVHGNDVNWDCYPRTDDFAQEFADLDDALRYANGEDDSYFAESTVPATRSYWPWERPPESYVIIEFGPRRPAKGK